MRRTLLVGFILAVVSCHRAVDPTSEREPVFEVGDFKVELDTSSSSDPMSAGTTWLGRGTLLTRDPRLQKGYFLIYLKVVDRANDEGPWKPTDVMIKDGIATLETSWYQYPKELKLKPRYEWQLVGYVPLQRGVLRTARE